MATQPANPFGGPFQGVPIAPTSPAPAPFSGASLYQIALALLFLYVIMRYVPNGLNIGLIILLGAVLATPDAVAGFRSAVHFIQAGV